jgi:hypothetical protein
VNVGSNGDSSTGGAGTAKIRPPLPFDPRSPRTRVVGGALGRLLLAVRDGVVRPERPNVKAVRSWRWGGEALPGDQTELVWSEAGLHLVLHGFGWDRHDGFARVSGKLNQPAVLELADGDTLTARFANVFNTSFAMREGWATHSYSVALDSWTWTAPGVCPTYWLGHLDGARTDSGNLVPYSSGTWSRSHLRFDGNYIIHVLTTGQAGTVLVVDTQGRTLDPALLGKDVRALEFAVGQSVSLRDLVAVDDEHAIVGACDPCFPDRTASGRRCPVPERGPTPATWVPVLAGLVAKRLGLETREDDPATLATAAYLESLTGNIHVGYLVGQVGLEAISKHWAPASPPSLVKDTPTWRAFVKSHEDEISALARGDDEARILLSRLNDNVCGPAAGAAVLAALAAADLAVTPQEQKELSRRNAAAHGLVMYKGEPPDVQELADRLALVQTLLVALLAKLVGYTGPIEGWKWGGDTLTRPTWWTVEDQEEAHVVYVAIDDRETHFD